MKDLLIKNLEELKFSFGAIGVKAEFESEGATFEEVKVLKNFADSAGLDFILKISGCEALRDLKDAKALGIKNIVAPMIESEYAFTKFVQGAQKILSENAKLWINIETMNGFLALDDILQNEKSAFLSGIVLGRTDFAGSLQLKCVNSPEINGVIDLTLKKAKNAKKKFIIGGGITPEAFNLSERFAGMSGLETRKIVFDAENLTFEGIEKALGFEMNWLQYKKEFSSDASDIARLEVLKKRCACK